MEEPRELDASTLFKDEASGVSEARNLSDALACFGFAITDKISRRELVTIFGTTRKTMEAEIFRLASCGQFTAAKEMRGRLNLIRREFDGHQLGACRRVREEQVELFERAKIELEQNMKNKLEEENEELHQTLSKNEMNHSLYKNIETTTLATTQNRIPSPAPRYSKRLLELLRAETSLNKLGQYDDAMKVRLMINRLLPNEEAAMETKFTQKLENERRRLEITQRENDRRLEESNSRLYWKNVRDQERKTQILQQRVKNHLKDMTHAHVLESKLKAETSIKPSHLWKRRDHFDYTASALRGKQLLDNARGKQMDDRVYAASLVERHNFDDPPQDTLPYTTRVDVHSQH